MEGWIKIFRKMTEWEWYKDGNTMRLFLHLLLTANTKEGYWQGTQIKRGQVATSLSSLANDLGLSIRNIRTSLAKLKTTRNLTCQATNKLTIITICKFEDYQEVAQTERQANRQTNGHDCDNKQEDKKKEDKNSIKKKIQKEKPLVFPFTSEAFMSAWDILMQQPKWIKKPNSALQLSLDKISKYNEAFAIMQIEAAIEKQWAGLVYPSTDEKYREWQQGGATPTAKSSKLDQYKAQAQRLGIFQYDTDQSNSIDEQ